MRVSVFSRERLFGTSLGSLLAHEGQFKVVGVESNPARCISISKEGLVQVVVLDACSFHTTDGEFFLGARETGDFKLLAVGSTPNGDFDANVARSALPQELFESVRSLVSRSRAAPLTIRERGVQYGRRMDLTQREYDVAVLISRGYSNRRIAEDTGLSEQTVKNYASTIMRKLRCENRVQVALKLADLEDSRGRDA
jgi:DNA-binding CsgD family transcriptional regulator